MAEKYTPNKPKDAGLEARQKLGWWHAYRFLVLRRISQLSIILMFLSGPIWQVWILKGNYSSSMLLDTVPLTDPLITAESLATGYLPEITLAPWLLLYSTLSLRVKPFVVGFAQ